MSIPKALRFEVFKRDSFTCQYCGKKAPDVVLHCDHMHPESQGGEATLLNLITACIDCNLGKSDRRLADDSVLEKQRVQLAALQERREQIDMMMDWQRGLGEIEVDTVGELADHFKRLADFDGNVTEVGRAILKKLLRKYGVVDLMEAMLAATERYIETDKNGRATNESASLAFGKIDGILAFVKQDRSHPYLKDLYYIRAIVRNRCDYFSPWQAKALLQDAFVRGASADDLKEIAKGANSWTQWRREMEDLLDMLRGATQ